MSLHSNSKSDSQSMSDCEINFTPQCITASVVCARVRGNSINKAVLALHLLYQHTASATSAF